jgi:hypothetical protein
MFHVEHSWLAVPNLKAGPKTLKPKSTIDPGPGL